MKDWTPLRTLRRFLASFVELRQNIVQQHDRRFAVLFSVQSDMGELQRDRRRALLSLGRELSGRHAVYLDDELVCMRSRGRIAPLDIRSQVLLKLVKVYLPDPGKLVKA